MDKAKALPDYVENCCKEAVSVGRCGSHAFLHIEHGVLAKQKSVGPAFDCAFVEQATGVHQRHRLQ